MAKNSQNIPDWMKKWPTGVNPPVLGLLKESREEMYETMTNFHSHVKFVIHVMLTAPVAVLAIMRLWPKDGMEPMLYLVAGGILIVVAPIGLISCFIIKKYYQVYVSALIFATRTHIKGGLALVHPWFERTISQADRWGAKNSAEFLEMRTVNNKDILALDHKDTLVLYRMIIIFLCIINLIAGIVFLYLGREVLIERYYWLLRFFSDYSQCAIILPGK